MSQDNRYHVGGGAAEIYQRNMVRRIFAPWARRLMAVANVAAGETVLDVACGTGVVARLAAAAAGPGGAVTGIEINPAMLEVARGLEAIDGAPIAWVEGDACAMPVPDGAFDLVLCQQGLQFFNDRAAAAREMRRALAPGGRLALTVWRPIAHAAGHAAVADAVERHVGADAAQSRRAPFEIGGADAVREVLVGAGFADVRVVIAADVVRFDSAENLVRTFMEGTPLAPFMAEAGAATVAAVIAMVAERVGDYQDDDGLALPMQTWVATARAG